METTPDAVTALLDQMSASDRQIVLDRLVYQSTNEKKRDFTPREVQVWQAVSTVTGENKPLSYFASRNGFRSRYKRGCDGICVWLEAGCGVDLDRQQMGSLLELTTESLVTRLSGQGHLGTLLGCLLNVDQMPAAMEDSYPGYWKAKMLHQLVTRIDVEGSLRRKLQRA